MRAQKTRAARIWHPYATPYKHIRIISHPIRRRKRSHIIAVKAITVAAVLLSIYGLLLLEFHPVAGLIIFGLCFPYLACFAWANGGRRHD